VTLTALERRLVDAFDDARATVRENPDLFARVSLSLDAARDRRRFRLRLAAGIVAFCGGCLSLAFALSDYDNGRITMDWWIIELITDIVLPGMSGVELAKTLSQERAGLEVLFMSGFPSDPRVAEAQAAGARILEKPFRHGALLDQVRSLLEN